MTQVNLQDLQAQLEQARAKAAEAVAQKMQVAKVQAELSLLTNEKFQEAKANQLIREETSAKIQSLMDLCAAIVENTPIAIRATGEQRKWQPNRSRRFGFGNQIADVLGLLGGIHFSAAEHSEQMHAATNLGKDLIEATLDAAGQLPYYSPNYNEIVVGTRTNAVKLVECLNLVESQLGIQLDKGLITDVVAGKQYDFAMARAQREAAEHELTANVQSFTIRG